MYDDGSTDGTFKYLKKNNRNIILLRNQSSKGYLYCRNKMLSETKVDFTIYLDDYTRLISEIQHKM
jgi:glycosyltransferase involved in cell wall biosynthesis